MTVLRIISIIISFAFIVLAILNFNGVLNETLQILMIVVGIITAVLNVISVVMWWITDEANQYNSRQLSWFRRGAN